MLGQVAAVMQQPREFDEDAGEAVQDKVTRSVHPPSGHAAAAERQMIDVGVR
jgi:hypothetical protein